MAQEIVIVGIDQVQKKKKEKQKIKILQHSANKCALIQAQSFKKKMLDEAWTWQTINNSLVALIFINIMKNVTKVLMNSTK